jgi:succinylarginine dihydrolase
MFADFRKAFAPTPEEIKRAQDIITRIEREETEYLRSLGFNDTDIEIIRAIESEETQHLCGFQSYSSRTDLIRSGIITVGDVRNDITRRINANEPI